MDKVNQPITAQTRRLMGVDSLDELLDGGVPDGNSVLVQGGPGTGKTILGMQFLCRGITDYGEPGLLITFEESPRRLYRDALALGWDLTSNERERKLLIIYTSASVFLKELEAGTYGAFCRQYGLRRVVVDSLAHFERISDSSDDVRVRFERVVNALRRDDLMVLMTRELETRDEPARVSPEEYLADTILQLQYVLSGGERIRLIEVLKHRGSAHSPLQHRFSISAGGLHLHAANQVR